MMSDDRLVLTNSMISTFKLCRKKAWFAYMARLEPKSKGLPLYRGSAVHAFIEALYRNGQRDPKVLSNIARNTYRDAVQMAAPHMSERDIEKAQKEIVVIAGIPYGYVKVYAEDLNNWEVLDVEKQVRTRIVHPVTGEVHPHCDYGMTLDALVRDRTKNTRHLVEHKTTTKMDNLYFKKLEMDPQIAGYQMGCAAIGLPIDSVIYNVIQIPGIRQKKTETLNTYYERLEHLLTSESDKYFHRAIIKISDLQMARFMLGLWNWADYIYALMTEQKEDWLRSDVYACTAYFRLCEFFEPCTYGLDGSYMLNYNVRSALHPEYEEERSNGPS